MENQRFNIEIDGVDKVAEVLKVLSIDGKEYVIYSVDNGDDSSDIFTSEIIKDEEGYDITVEIMIPLVGEVKELKFVKNIVVETAEQVKKEKNSDIKYHIGTMIEIPRAALTADKIATESEFFSFGTNDLTQLTYGFSRDDASKFLNDYGNDIFSQNLVWRNKNINSLKGIAT